MDSHIHDKLYAPAAVARLGLELEALSLLSTIEYRHVPMISKTAYWDSK